MNHSLIRKAFVVALAFGCVTSAQAKPKVSSKTLLKEANAALDKVADSSEHQIRLAVFESKVSLARKSRPIIRAGLSSQILSIKKRAIEMALGSRSSKLKESGVEAVGGLLCSESSEDVSAGQGLRLKIKKKKLKRKLRVRVVDCPGSGLAEEAKESLISSGGVKGWSLIEKDVLNNTDLTKRNEAFKLALKSRSKSSAAWAAKRVHEETELGDLAREIIIDLAGTRLGRSYVARFKREYRAAKRDDDFAKRLRLAMILGNLSGVRSVQDTLFAAFSPNYKAPEGITNTQERAWKGLKNVRDFKVLKRDISKSHKLKVRDLFCNVNTKGEAKAAFEWLYKWTKKSQSKKLYAILKKCFKSDHTNARVESVKALAKLGSRSTLSLFEEALKESNPTIRHAGARGIAAVASKGDEARLGRLLQREREEEGKLALIAGLRRIGTKESIAPLKFLVFRQPKAVTLAVVDALASTKDPAIAKNIAALKSSSDSDIRMKVWKYLLSLDPDNYVTSFVNTATSWVKPRHIVELSKVKDIPLNVFAQLAAKASLEVSAQSMRVLGKAGDEGASFILETIETHKSEEVAAEALRVLGQLRKKDSLNYYAKALTHSHGLVRAVAAQLVATYGSKRKHLGAVMKNRSDKNVTASIAAHVASYKLSRKRR
jgi:HEAT repeat protein